jgi:hypothetical protein
VRKIFLLYLDLCKLRDIAGQYFPDNDSKRDGYLECLDDVIGMIEFRVKEKEKTL